MVLEKNINANNDGHMYLKMQLLVLMLLLLVHGVVVFVVVFLLGTTTLNSTLLLRVLFIGDIPQLMRR